LFAFNLKHQCLEPFPQKKQFFIQYIVLLLKKYERTLFYPPYCIPTPSSQKMPKPHHVQLCKIADDAELKERRFRRTEAEEGEL
jgi:hypothetical protein